MNIQEVLSPQELAQYQQQGYSIQEIQQSLNEVEMESGQTSMLQKSFNQTQMQQDPRMNASNSMFAGFNQENLIKWQLELDSILERVEHMLRGDKIKFQNGQIIWTPAEKDGDKILNDFGVAEIMRILSMYLNRNTILSNYDEATINWKVYDFGNEISDLIFLKYEAMGLDNLEKRKLYPIIIRELVDTIHSSYLRALHGGERDSLREARSIQQTEQMQGGMVINTGGLPSARERGVMNPLRYFIGKHK